MQFASCGYGKIVLWKHDGTIADVKFGPAGDPSKAESSQLVYNDLAWNSENRALVVGDNDGGISLYGIDGVLVKRLCDKQGVEVNSLALRTGLRYLITASSDALIRQWDIKKLSVVRTIAGHKAAATGVCLTFDESHFVTCGADGQVFVFNHTNGKMSSKFSIADADALQAIRHSPTKHQVSSCGDSGNVYTWDLSREILLSKCLVHSAPCTGVAYSLTNDQLLLTAGLDKKVTLLDLTSQKLAKSVLIASPVSCIDFSCDGQRFAVGTETGSIFVFDVRSTEKPIIEIPSAHPNGVRSVKFQYDTTLLSSRRSKMRSSSSPIVMSTPTDSGLTASYTEPVSPLDSSMRGRLSSGSSVLSPLRMGGLSDSFSGGDATLDTNFFTSGIGATPRRAVDVSSILSPTRDGRRMGDSVNGSSWFSSALPSLVLTPNNKADKHKSSVVTSPVRQMELPPLSPDIRRTHGAQLTFTPSPAVPPSRQNVAASTTQLSSPTRTVDRFSGKTHNTDKQESSNQDGKRTSLPKDDIAPSMPEAVTRSDTYDLDVKLFNLKEELIEHIHNLHSDMVQQFYMQHKELLAAVNELTAQNAKLLEELRRLREENEELKRHLY